MNRWLLPALLVMLTCVVVFLVPIGEEVGTGLDGEDDAGARHDPEAPTLAGSGIPSGDAAGVTDAAIAESTSAAEPKPWFLTATVTTGDNEAPIAGATVVVYLQVGSDYERLAEGVSGPDGNVSIDLRFLSKRSRTQLGLARLVASTTAPGHHGPGAMSDRVMQLIDDDLMPTAWALRVSMVAGPTVRGRIVSEHGEPIAQSVVNLRPGPVNGPIPVVSSDPDGHFVLPVVRPGTCRVHAQRRDMHGGRSAPITLSGSEDFRVPDIKLRRRTPTEGRVRFKDGTPVSDFEFEITGPWLDQHWRRWDRSHYGLIRVRTDGLGGFSAKLPPLTHPGHGYTPPWRVHVYGVDSVDTGFDPRARAFDLILPAHRLRVQLRDDQDAPLRAQEVSLEFGTKHGAESVSGTTDRRGEVSFFVPPGSQGTLRILRIGNALLAVPVSIPKTGNESTISVSVPDRTRVGRVQFQIRTPAGGRVFPVDVYVDAPGGHRVAKETFYRDGDHIKLPPGAYKVWLYSDAKPPWDDLPGLRSFLRLTEPLVIRDGETTSVDVIWKPTAAIALRVTASDASGVELADSRVLLEHVGGERERFRLKRKDQDWFGGVFLDEWMFSNQMYVPGFYRLTVEARGYRSVTREVRVQDGRVSRIEIALERAP